MQRHHRARHRWIWVMVFLAAVIALGTGLTVRPDYPVHAESGVR